MSNILNGNQLLRQIQHAIPQLKDLHIASLEIHLTAREGIKLVVETIAYDDQKEIPILQLGEDRVHKEIISRRTYLLTDMNIPIQSDEFFRELGANFPGLEELIVRRLRIRSSHMERTYVRAKITGITNANEDPIMSVDFYIAPKNGELYFSKTYGLTLESEEK